MKKTVLLASLLAFAGVGAGAAAWAANEGPWMSRIDADGDGRVSVEEVEADAAARAAEIDADDDGFITPEEQRAFREQMMEEARARRFPDQDGDGVVDLVEYETAARERFAKLDRNGDGVLAEDEVPQRHGGPHKHRRR